MPTVEPAGSGSGIRGAHFCEALGLEGARYCRGYIQAWLAGDEIPEKSGRRNFAAADKILRAGAVR